MLQESQEQAGVAQDGRKKRTAVTRKSGRAVAVDKKSFYGAGV